METRGLRVSAGLNAGISVGLQPVNKLFDAMRKVACNKSGALLTKAGSLLVRVGQRMRGSPEHSRTMAWFRDRGDSTLRLHYDLDERSVVLDVGGYEGQWASDVYSMYCCTIHIFEPVAEFADSIRERFSRNPEIFVHSVGLSNEATTAEISVDRDNSSVYKRGGDTRVGRLVRASSFMRDHGIDRVDLMKINIEGGEYALLEDLLASGFVRKVGNIQVQFHDFVPNAELRMRAIQEELQNTHRLTYQYPFVWENWELQQP